MGLYKLIVSVYLVQKTKSIRPLRKYILIRRTSKLMEILLNTAFECKI